MPKIKLALTARDRDSAIATRGATGPLPHLFRVTSLFLTRVGIANALILLPVLAAPAQPVIINSSIDSAAWSAERGVCPLTRQNLRVKVDSIPRTSISWYQIIPECSRHYQNANHPWQDNPYKWTGFDRIKYDKRELRQFRGQWQIEPAVQRLFADNRLADSCAGSYWLQAVIRSDSTTMSSPGLEAADYRGLSPETFRVSFRNDTGLVGYLTSFFNVPGLFGSTPYQSRNYIGVDCADVLMAAYALSRGKTLTKDYNVAMIVTTFRTMASFKIIGGVPNKRTFWSKHIRRGDLIAVRYDGQRQYQHIGALYQDTNNDGILNSDDVILHAGPGPLQKSPLSDGAFDGHVRIVRLP